jgi:hypothetical protein
VLTATLDPGSAFSGLVVGDPSPGGGVRLLLAVIIPTAPDLEATAAAIVGALAPFAPARLVSELAPEPYFPRGCSSFAATAISRNFRTMERLVSLVEAKLPPGVASSHLPRPRWSRALLPHHRGGIPNSLAHAAALRHLSPSSPVQPPPLSSPHLLDALGVLAATFLRDQPEASRGGGGAGGELRDGAPILPSQRPEAEADGEGPPTPSAPQDGAPAAPSPALPTARLAARRLTRAAHAARARHAAAAPQLELCRCGPGGRPRPPTARGRHDLGCPAGRSS